MNTILCRLIAHWRRRNHAARMARQGAHHSATLRNRMHEVKP